jgi:hypothetical protein
VSYWSAAGLVPRQWYISVNDCDPTPATRIGEIMRIVVAFVAVAGTLVLVAPANADDGKLDAETCVGLTGAQMNLLMALNPQDARSPADILEKSSPPDPVKQAIEHFVSTGGVQSSDLNADQMNKTIDDWTRQVCS